MDIKQNLSIIKNISSIDIDFNRCLVSTAYQLFSNDREIDDNVYNEEIKKFKESLQNIKVSIKNIEETIENVKNDDNE